jgi:hypothetical protein
MTRLLAAFVALTLATPALSQSVPTEVSRLGGQQVTLHLHPFLTADELAMLRVVASNDQALAVFITTPGRHAAMALAPDEGFVRGGQPVTSAFAISDLQTPEDARTGALEGCERARRAGPACVVVLEVAPAP